MKDYTIGLVLGLLFGGVALALAGHLWSILAFLAGLGAFLGAIVGRFKPLEEVDDAYRAFWNLFFTAFVLLLLSLVPAFGVVAWLFAYLQYVGYFLLFYAFGLFAGVTSKVASAYVQVLKK